MAFFHTFLLGSLVLAGALPALSSPLVEGRAECNRNNINRCLSPTGTKAADIASRAAATAYCSSYLSVPVVTSVIATTTPVTSTTTYTTTTDSTETSTTVTTTTTTIGAILLRRATPVPVVAPPSCLGTTYSPAQLSAACSCLGVIPSTTHVTATAATSIVIYTSTLHDTTTTTTTTTSVSTSILPSPPPTEDPDCPTAADDVFIFTSETEIKKFCFYDGVGITTPNFVDYNTATLGECVAICAADAACVAADYEPNSNGLCEVLSTGGTFAYGPQFSVVIRSTEPQPPPPV
ncbi:hypothetical protein GE09DRAFT_1055656 [Coniochaeta sp. 2T2.1]|nr:hypothetical protein GE09DRAFT_1055656 [Coniochaeta sp. 2T2.1]